MFAPVAHAGHGQERNAPRRLLSTRGEAGNRNFRNEKVKGSNPFSTTTQICLLTRALACVCKDSVVTINNSGPTPSGLNELIDDLYFELSEFWAVDTSNLVDVRRALRHVLGIISEFRNYNVETTGARVYSGVIASDTDLIEAHVVVRNNVHHGLTKADPATTGPLVPGPRLVPSPDLWPGTVHRWKHLVELTAVEQAVLFSGKYALDHARRYENQLAGLPLRQTLRSARTALVNWAFTVGAARRP
jgi:hypothetical protein